MNMMDITQLFHQDAKSHRQTQVNLTLPLDRWQEDSCTFVREMNYIRWYNSSALTYVVNMFGVSYFYQVVCLILYWQPDATGHVPCASEYTVVPMEITFLDNGRNIFVLDELIEQMNSYI